MLLGPTVLNMFHFNPLKEAALLEVLTEVAVLISLFSAGVKMPAPISFTRWRTPVLLATVAISVMLGMLGSGASWRMRSMTGWFGVRGVGSLYYLILAAQAPALNKGGKSLLIY